MIVSSVLSQTGEAHRPSAPISTIGGAPEIKERVVVAIQHECAESDISCDDGQAEQIISACETAAVLGEQAHIPLYLNETALEPILDVIMPAEGEVIPESCWDQINHLYLSDGSFIRYSADSWLTGHSTALAVAQAC